MGKRGTLTPSKLLSRRNTSDSRLLVSNNIKPQNTTLQVMTWYVQNSEQVIHSQCGSGHHVWWQVPLRWANLSAGRIVWLSVNQADMTFCLLCVFPWKNSFHIYRIISLQNKELKQQRQTFKIKKDGTGPRAKLSDWPWPRCWNRLWHCKADLLWGLDYVLMVSRFSVREIIKYKWNNIKLFYRLNFYRILPVWHHSPKFTRRE